MSWTKLESGTDVDLLDIYGTPDGKEIWTCGWNESGGGVILRKDGTLWQKLWDERLPASSSPYNGELLGTLWTNGDKEYFITGSGDVFRHSIVHREIIRREPVGLGKYAYRIRGAGRQSGGGAGALGRLAAAGCPGTATMPRTDQYRHFLPVAVRFRADP